MEEILSVFFGLANDKIIEKLKRLFGLVSKDIRPVYRENRLQRDERKVDIILFGECC